MRTGYFSGNVLKLTEDMQALKPTFFPTVPRLLNRIYGKIKEKLDEATGLKGWLVQRGLSSKIRYLKEGNHNSHFFYDKLIFGKTKALLGGNIKCIVSGSAPISGDVLDFLQVCFSCKIVEGYGLTETCGAAVVTLLSDPTTGIVGGPLQGVKLKLKDLPEMGYMTTDSPPRGEICFWGQSIMKGYFMNPEKTAESFS
jgi:long-chain acyl-CoA synthetase